MDNVYVNFRYSTGGGRCTTVKLVPRVGETVIISGVTYTVVEVTHNTDTGEIIIDIEEK